VAVSRIVIENVGPRTPGGIHPPKSVTGEVVRTTAEIYRDGHDELSAAVRWRANAASKWNRAPMVEVGIDAWEGTFTPEVIGAHTFIVEAWTDRYLTWRKNLIANIDGGQDVTVDIEEGAALLEQHRVPASERAPLVEAVATLRNESLSLRDRLLPAVDSEMAELVARYPVRDDLTRSASMHLWVDPQRALFGAWYEMFPRSEGGFEGTMKRLRHIAAMGFDVVYFPPIHPIGTTHRKGRNNALTAKPEDPGSPWAIGSAEGGHTTVNADLGTIEDFDRLVAEAESLDMEIALDYALQCSPDHPWVKEHPEWFHHRPDGTIKYAENPPKKYQDIYPLNFWPDTGREQMWEACKEIIDFWISHGVKIFRVDNPHTKPFAFWEWMLADIKSAHPEVIFLAEAFTRPTIMAKLAEIGFTQSYTYFTWRRHKWELTEYLNELAYGPASGYLRPNFWPNTPDILSGSLRNGPPAAFMQRLVLAATMSPSYGIYSGYELCENQPASEENEEYLHSEKYEIPERDWSSASLAVFVGRVNNIRRKHPALQQLRNIRFHHSSNDSVIAYSKVTEDRSDVVLTVVSLDPHWVQETTLGLDLEYLGLRGDRPFGVVDELDGKSYVLDGANPYIRLDPSERPAHILHIV